jgi:CMP/dCMP kinase
MPNIRDYKYANIAISGLPGSGSTTLLRLLKEELDLDGWRGYSGGEFMRAYAAEKGLFDDSKKLHHFATDYEDDFDRQIDMGVREKLQTQKKWIFEAWLAGFLAQGLDNTLKVLVICSDDAVRIDRIVNRDEVNVDEAKHHIKQRYADNLAKWARMYSKEWQEWVVDPGTLSEHNPIDFWNPKLYDVVIDTYSTNQSKTLSIVLDAITQKKPAAKI